MARVYTCDICKQRTEKIVGKLQYIPMTRDGRKTHSDYTHHCDVGVCCGSKILKVLNFRERMTRAEYLASRKAG